MDITVSMESSSVQFWRAKAVRREQQAEVQRLEALVEQQYIRRRDPEQAYDAELSLLWLFAAISEYPA